MVDDRLRLGLRLAAYLLPIALLLRRRRSTAARAAAAVGSRRRFVDEMDVVAVVARQIGTLINLGVGLVKNRAIRRGTVLRFPDAAAGKWLLRIFASLIFVINLAIVTDCLNDFFNQQYCPMVAVCFSCFANKDPTFSGLFFSNLKK